ncbi:MAG: GNAT family N-acetyltransferase [FCB group bacterium]|nr:GNAT family N-acetyltransferase [FCB group bacterium]
MAIRIIEISSNDRPDLVESIISLLLEQMKVLGKDHSAEEIRSAVINALKPESRGLFFIAYGDDNPTETEPAGFCFINICSGIEAGGDYVWINEIHTRADRRSQGVGLALVKHVIDWGEKNNCRYIAGITSLKNRAARNLFAHYGFNDNQVIWLDKTL